MYILTGLGLLTLFARLSESIVRRSFFVYVVDELRNHQREVVLQL